jgi:hypothetical protein
MNLSFNIIQKVLMFPLIQCHLEEVFIATAFRWRRCSFVIRLSATGSTSLSGSSSFDGSSDDREDIRTVLRDLDVASQALHKESQEAEWLQACLSIYHEGTLGAADQETIVAKVAAMVDLAELAGKVASLPLCRAWSSFNPSA